MASLFFCAPDRTWAQACTAVPTIHSCAVPGHLCPALVSSAPATVSAGVRQQRLTLIGSNFRPGAQVVITVPNEDPSPLAPDVTVHSTTVVNSGLIFAVVDVNRLSSGIRSVDVVNTDCTNTADGNLNLPLPDPGSVTTQQVFISGTNSLAGPVQVDNLIVTYPRDGTVVNQGDDLYGEAVLAGAGTGLVTGAWLWDGNVNEQFTANLSGGESTVLRTSVLLPTFYLGRHTLELQITSPQSMVSRLVRVVVDSGDFKLFRLLLPRSGEGFGDANPPALRWTAVPGASKYEVGFSASPHFDSIGDWYEVSDNRWQVPAKVWGQLPEGELYWTVRPVEISGEIRPPAPLRSIWHMSPGVLEAASVQPGISPTGSVLLQWHGLRARVFYRLTITRDAAGGDVVRRYLTGSAQADLYALRDVLQPGKTFYWQVQAVSPFGQLIRIGPRQSFVVPAGAHAQVRRPGPSLVQASLRTPGISADLTANITKHSPASGENVASDQPTIDVAFGQGVDVNKLALSVDSTDVTAVAEVAATSVKYAPVFPLDNGEHTVEVDVAPDSSNWKFSVAHKEPPPPLAVLPTGKNDAEVVPKKETPAPSVPGEVGPEFKTHFGLNPQAGSSPTPNQVALTGGEQTTFQNGPWRAEINGTAMLDALLSPSPDHLFGHTQDYNALLTYKRDGWGINARFGLIAPDLYKDAQFITTATARQAVEPSVTTPAGTMSYYANTNDINLGGGDASSFDQLIRGAGYQAPLPTSWGAFRLMWMDSKDVGTPTTVLNTTNGPVPNSNLYPPTVIDQQASPGAADAYGGFLKLQLASSFALISEYAVSYDNPNTVPPTFPPGAMANPPDLTPIPTNGPLTCIFQPQLSAMGFVPQACGVGPGGKRLYGRAWRTGLAGKWRKTTISVAYRDVSTNFATPVNPGITPYSNPGRKGFDSSVTQGTPVGDFNVGFQYLQSLATIVNPVPTTFRNLTGGWKKGFKSKTQFSIRGHEVTTTNGSLPASLQGVAAPMLTSEGMLVDQHDVGFNASILQQVHSLTLTATASRDWFRNDLTTSQDSIVTGTQFSAVWRRQSVFQLQSNVSANWSVGDRTTVGGTRILSLYLMPMFMWQHTGLSLTPLASITQTKGNLANDVLTSDLLTSQLGGRLSWRLTSKLHRPTLSVEGARVQMQNSLATTAMPSFNMVDKRLAILLSFAHDQTQGRL